MMLTRERIILNSFLRGCSLKFVSSDHESLAGRVELLNLREFTLVEMAHLQNPELSLARGSAFDIIFNSGRIEELAERALEARPFQLILQSALESHLIWGGLPELSSEASDKGRLRISWGLFADLLRKGYSRY